MPLAQVTYQLSSVANLRQKAAQSGAEIRDHDTESDSSASYYSSSSDEDDDSDTASAPANKDGSAVTPESVASQCLFCDARSADVDANMVHMASTHSFVVPYQSSLVVDAATLVWYLHLVIYTYHECIACGSRRRSAPAVQQHMQSKGHCRLDMGNAEMVEFYDAAALDSTRLLAGLGEADEGTLRLASGRLISQRGLREQQPSSASGQASTRNRLEQPQEERNTETAVVAQGGDSERQVVLDKSDRKMATAARQMAQLSVRDQQALAHLTPSEQRKELALRKKQIDQTRRAEWRAAAALGRKGNNTLTKHHRAAGPERPLG